ncbi:MAG: FAD-binding protein [Desulfobacterales bacterium]|nr:FAD-binding protein [Desulfobacterales bacterium]
MRVPLPQGPARRPGAPDQLGAQAPAGSQKLEDAPVVVCGGRGMGSKKQVHEALTSLPRLLGGEVGATRPVVYARLGGRRRPGGPGRQAHQAARSSSPSGSAGPSSTPPASSTQDSSSP